MRILIVRHGVPDYQRDTLTAQGWKEAELLAPYLVRENPDRILLSPYGRAQDTAKKTIELTGIVPEVREWLCEFDGGALAGNALPNFASWHQPPQVWEPDPLCLTDRWRESDLFRDTNFVRRYDEDKVQLEQFLSELGYDRQGAGFRVREEFFDSNPTVLFFCHLGRCVVLLSQLLDLPFMTVASRFWIPTSSITEVIFERSSVDRGYAIARCGCVGSVPHLQTAGVPRYNSGFLMPYGGYTRASDPTVQQAKE